MQCFLFVLSDCEDRMVKTWVGMPTAYRDACVFSLKCHREAEPTFCHAALSKSNGIIANENGDISFLPLLKAGSLRMTKLCLRAEVPCDSWCNSTAHRRSLATASYQMNHQLEDVHACPQPINTYQCVLYMAQERVYKVTGVMQLSGTSIWCFFQLVSLDLEFSSK